MSKSIPKIHFKKFQKEWKKIKLGDISEIKTGSSASPTEKDVKNGVPIITLKHFKDGYLPINKKDILKVSDEGCTKLKSYILDEGDIVFPKVGPIDINILVKQENKGCLFSERLLRVRLDSGFDPNFIHYTLDTIRVRNNIRARAIGQTTPSINAESLKEIPITITLLKEQEKISTFFKQLDNIIALQQQLIQQQQQYKKVMLKRMLPQKDERVPKIRYKGFTSEWQERKLGEFGNSIGGTSMESEFTERGAYRVISTNSYSENNEYVDEGIRANFTVKTKKYILNKNDITMILNDKISSGNTIGRVLKIEEDNSYVYSQGIQRIEINQTQFDSQFLYQYLNADFIRSKIVKSAQGNDQIYVNWSSISKLSYLIPYSREEQEKIGSFFKQIDNKIALYKQKLESYQQLKKALLQRMFF